MEPMQNTVPMLPEVDPTRSGVPPLQPGEWSVSRDIALANVAKVLVTSTLSPEKFSIDSVPDIWAQPLLFEAALRDESHPLHLKVRGEWRGLLALLAFWEILSLPLKAQKLVIPEANRVNGRGFLSAAAKLCPTRYLWKDTPWQQLAIFTYNGRAVAMTSPVTLVCAARDNRGRFDRRVPWVTEEGGGRLIDPCSSLTKAQQGALAHWLTGVRDGVAHHPPSSEAGEGINQLVRLLQAFIDELGAVERRETSNRLLAEIDFGVYSVLRCPLKPREVEPKNSSALLVAEKGFNPTVRLLVIDPGIAKQWRIQEAEVALAGRETLASLDFSKLQEIRRSDREKLRTLGVVQQLPGAEWRTKAMLFSERLLLLAAFDQQQPLLHQREVEGQRNLNWEGFPVTPVLPIASELLDHLSVESLQQRITFYQDSPGGPITVRLRLPLRGTGEVSRDIELEQVYTATTIEFRVVLPVLEIWPNFRMVSRDKDASWDRYYTYYSSTGRQDAFVAQPHCGPGNSQDTETVQSNPSENDIRQITRTTLPPTAMICRVALPGGRQDLEVGVLLLQDLPERKTRDDSWSISVDFGTSATHVYVSPSAGGAPRPLELKDQLLRITAVEEDYRTELDDRFLPTFVPERPFPTLFRPEYDHRGAGIFFQGNIRYFKPRVGGSVGAAQTYTAPSLREVQANLKWTENTEWLKAFLNQLAHQIAAIAVEQGVVNLSWRISYPTAFSLNQHTTLLNTWKRIVRELPLRTDELSFHTESEAAASYFQKVEEVSLQQTICIDIGSGTSDISVWMGPNLLLQQSSIKFAGENIFMRLLEKNPQVLRHLNPDWGKVLQRARETEGAGGRFYAVADSLLRTIRDEMFELLPEKMITRPNDPLYRMVHLIALGLSGLLYYSGLLLRRLHIDTDTLPSPQLQHIDTKTLQEWRESNALPYLCVGGNGSRAFQWLSLGRPFSRNTVHNVLFANMLRTTSDLQGEDRLQVWISSRPKAEAAWGLLTLDRQVTHDDKENDNKEKAKAIIELVGESLESLDGTPVPWHEPITSELLTRGLRAPADLASLRQFVEVYNRYAVKKNSYACPIDYTNARARLIRDRLQDELDRYKGLDPNAVVPKPLFVLALDALLEEEIELWTQLG